MTDHSHEAVVERCIKALVHVDATLPYPTFHESVEGLLMALQPGDRLSNGNVVGNYNDGVEAAAKKLDEIVGKLHFRWSGDVGTTHNIGKAMIQTLEVAVEEIRAMIEASHGK